MQAIQDIGISQGAVQGIAIGRQEPMGTGDGDFLSYLLGLQTSSQQDLLSELMPSTQESVTEGGKDKDLNLLFNIDPGLTGMQAQNQQPLESLFKEVQWEGPSTPMLDTLDSHGLELNRIDSLKGLTELEVADNSSPQSRELDLNELLEKNGVKVVHVETFEGDEGVALESSKGDPMPQLGLRDEPKVPQLRQAAVRAYSEAPSNPYKVESRVDNRNMDAQTSVSREVDTEGPVRVLVSEKPTENLKPREDRDDGSGLDFHPGDTQQVMTKQTVSVETPTAQIHVDKPKNVSEVISSIESTARQGGGKMTVSLNPPDLGQVEIDVISKGNTIEVKMRSENGTTKSLLESHFDNLESALKSRDLILSKMEVTVSRDVFQAQDFKQSFSDPGYNGFSQGSGFGQGGNHFAQGNPNQQHFGRDTMRFQGDLMEPSLKVSRTPSRQSGVDLRI